MKYPDEFEQLWRIYPKRAGNNPKRKAFNAYKARLREGVRYEALQAGILRYYNFCRQTDRIGSEYVQQAATFFGLNEAWDEAWEPPKKEIKETIEEKGKRLNILPKRGETMDEYTRRIQQARG